MLSMGGWTNTNVGALVFPKAEAVTSATPILPPVQVVNAASHTPAHATPLGAIFTIEVSLEAKMKVAEMLVFDEFCAEALKLKVLPTWTEALSVGFKLIFAANVDWPGGRCPPHPLMLHKKMIANTNCRPLERNLPMHPSSL
jgi:hypothetical protein